VRLLLQELFGYGAASGCALLIDVAILFALVHYLSWGYLPAATLSFLSGSFVAYGLSTTMVFKQHRLSKRKTEFASFVAIGGIGLLVNAAILFIGVSLLGIHYLIAKCAAAGFTFVTNFVLRRQMLFVRRTAC